jgi:hypothetical protein
MNHRWKTFLKESKLRVFDFDDTLVKTDASVKISLPDGETLTLNAEQFANHKMDPNNKYDFSDFNDVVNPTEIMKVTNILRNTVNAGGVREVVILTARDPEAQPAIERWLGEIGIDIKKINITCLATSDPRAKANWIENKIVDGVSDVLFLDDSGKNVKAVNSLKADYPEVKIDARIVKYASEL